MFIVFFDRTLSLLFRSLLCQPKESVVKFVFFTAPNFYGNIVYLSYLGTFIITHQKGIFP